MDCENGSENVLRNRIGDYEAMVGCALAKTATDALSRNPKLVATMLEEYNLWRRGDGEYAFDEDPMAKGKNKECPVSSKLLGIALDCAVHLLRGVEKVEA